MSLYKTTKMQTTSMHNNADVTFPLRLQIILSMYYTVVHSPYTLARQLMNDKL